MRRLEALAVLATALVIVGTPVAAFGYETMLRSANANEITITARTPQNGGWSPSTIYVKQGDKIRLRLTSGDVVHGLAIPELGVQVDEIYPGKFTTVEFVANNAGRYPFYCTVFCSPRHGEMTGEIVVSGTAQQEQGASPATPAPSVTATTRVEEQEQMAMPTATAPASAANGRGEQERKPSPTVPQQAQAPAQLDLLAKGKKLYQSNCAACHGVNGAGGTKLGAATSADLRQQALEGMYHNDATLLERAILDGRDEDGEVLNAVMPRWRGKLSEADVKAIIAYLNTLH